MDPNSGRVFPSMQAAYLAGVENPVELTGRPEDIERISTAVAAVHAGEKAAKRAKNKAARAARRNNR